MNTATHYQFAGMGQLQAASLALGPYGAIAGAVLTVGEMIYSFFSQPDYKKIATTQIANKAATLLQQNLSAWQGLSASQKTPATQAAALQNFDQVWQAMVAACQTSQYGSAGTACVQDRQAGACKWKDAAGNCWNWFIGYRDPIANDPAVAANAAAAAATGAGAPLPTAGSAAISGIDFTPILLIGGLIAAVFAIQR